MCCMGHVLLPMSPTESRQFLLMLMKGGQRALCRRKQLLGKNLQSVFGGQDSLPMSAIEVKECLPALRKGRQWGRHPTSSLWHPCTSKRCCMCQALGWT